MKIEKNQVLIFVVSLLLVGSLSTPTVSGRESQLEENSFFVEITRPEEDETLNSPDVVVEWESEGADVHFVVLNEDERNETLGPEARSHTFEEVEDGDHFVGVGIRSEEEEDPEYDIVNFTIDTPDVSVEITRPDEGEIIDSPDVDVEWSSQEVTYHEINLNDEGWNNIGGATSHTFEDLDDGEHYVEVKGVYRDEEEDLKINDTDEVSFEVDVDYPEIDIFSPEEGDVLAEDEVTVIWEANNTASHQIRINEGMWEDIGEDTLHTFRDLDDGEHLVEVRGVSDFDEDVLDHDEVSFTVDTIPPVIEVISPDYGQIFTTDSVGVEWEITSEVTEIDEQWIIDEEGERINLTRRDDRFQFSGLNDGEHNIEINARDEAGNMGEGLISFVVDTEPPELEIIEPGEGEKFTSDRVTVIWEGHDEGTGIKSYEIKIEHKDWIEPQTSNRHDFDRLIDGEYTVQVRAWDHTDREDNYTVEEVTFVIDTGTEDLSVEISEPEDGSTVRGSNMTVRWTSSGADYYEVRIDGGSWIEVRNRTEYTFTDLPADEYEITVRAINEDDWRRTDEVTVELEEKIHVESGLLGSTYLIWIIFALVIANIAVILYIYFTKE